MINSGIYKIENIVNGKVYIGSAECFRKRFASHKCLLRKGLGSRHLQNAWDKYGESSFQFVVIEEVIDVTKLLVREQYYMNLFNAIDSKCGYNLRPKATNNLGIKYTEESKKGMRWSHDKKRKKVVSHKVSKSLTGHYISKKTRKLISKKLKGHVAGFAKGGHHTVASRRRMSISHKGKKLTAEHIKNISKSLKGIVFTEEHKKNLRHPNKQKSNDQ